MHVVVNHYPNMNYIAMETMQGIYVVSQLYIHAYNFYLYLNIGATTLVTSNYFILFSIYT